MITEETRKQWEEKDNERIAELFKEGEEAGIPAAEIQGMIDTLKPEWDAMTERMDKSGFFDKK